MRSLAVGIVIVASLALLVWRASDSAAANSLSSIRAAAVGDRSGDYVRTLAEGIGPRLTGSLRLERATDWARQEMERIGLEGVRLEEWGEVPVTFERGPSRGVLLGEEPRPLRFLVDAWSAGTAGPLRGRVVGAPETLEDWDRNRADLRGSWVLVETSLPGPAQELGASYGIAGFVQRPRGDDLMACGVMPARRSDLPTLPVVQLSNDDFAAVWERVRRGPPPELEFDLVHEFGDPRTAHNVIGDIVGSDKPDEFVILSAHLDSWDVGQGAADNAAGVAVVLEAARRIVASGQVPRRTIRIALWTGEEQGLLGARAYVKDRRSEMSAVSVVLNVDAGANPITGASVPAAYVEPIREAFAAVDGFVTREVPPPALSPSASAASCLPDAACKPATCPPTTACGPNGGDSANAACAPAGGCQTTTSCGKGSGAACSSDHVAFLEAGVPALSFEQSGPLDYERSHHTPHDTMDAVVDEYLRRSAETLAIGALHLANRDELVPRERKGAGGASSTRPVFMR